MRVRIWVCCGWLLCPLIHAEEEYLAPVIDSSTYGKSAARKSTNNRALQETLGRLQQLQKEIQQLRGEVEKQSYIIEDLKKRQEQLEQTNLATTDNTSTAGAFTPGVVTQSPTNVSVPPLVTATEYPSTSSQEYTLKKRTKIDYTKDPNTQKAYQQAYDVLRMGDHAEAISLFSEFLKNHSNSAYADNALYWIGEAHSVSNDFVAASDAFQKVIDYYPESPKIPDAMLKLGYIEFKKKNWDKTKTLLTDLIAKYPNTTPANLAAKKLNQIPVN